jgi:hypothetical protein
MEILTFSVEGLVKAAPEDVAGRMACVRGQLNVLTTSSREAWLTGMDNSGEQRVGLCLCGSNPPDLSQFSSRNERDASIQHCPVLVWGMIRYAEGCFMMENVSCILVVLPDGYKAVYDENGWRSASTGGLGEAHGQDVGRGRIAPTSDLEYWSFVGNTAMVRSLIEGGMDVNEKGANGYTALHAAAANGNLEVVKLLLEYGAKVSQLASGETPLDLAITTGQMAVVQFLDRLRISRAKDHGDGKTDAS